VKPLQRFSNGSGKGPFVGKNVERALFKYHKAIRPFPSTPESLRVHLEVALIQQRRRQVREIFFGSRVNEGTLGDDLHPCEIGDFFDPLIPGLGVFSLEGKLLSSKVEVKSELGRICRLAKHSDPNKKEKRRSTVDSA